MLKRFFKKIYKILEFFLAVFVILILLLIFRLSLGPIHIKDLTPVIIHALTPDDSQIQVSVRDAYVELALSRGRLMDVSLEEMVVSSDQDFILNVNNAHLSFNPFALLIGRVVVSDLHLNKAFLQVDLSSQKLQSDNDQDKKVSIEKKINRIRRHFEHLDTVSFKDTEATILLPDDNKIVMPKLTVELQRRDSNIHTHLMTQFYFDKTFFDISATGIYSTKNKKASFTVSANNLDLSKLQDLIPVFANVELIINANVQADLNLGIVKSGWINVFEKMAFSIDSTEEGSFYLEKPLDTKYSLDSMKIQGEVNSGLKDVVLDNSDVVLNGKKADIQATLHHLDDFILSGQFDKTSTELKATLYDVPFTDVPRLWPEALGSETHAWIKQNIPQGTINKATLDLQMKGTGVQDLTSVLDVTGAKVVYLDPMPAIEDLKAQIILKMTGAEIIADSGVCNNMQITGGRVKFLDFDKDTVLFDTNVQLSGKIKDALSIVSTEPLKVCDDMPISCADIEGNAVGVLQLHFPFSEDLEDKLTFSVKGDLEKVALPVPQINWQFDEGSLKLSVNNDKLTIKGQGQIENKTAYVDIRQSLTDETDGAYEFKAPLSPSMIKPYFANINEFFKGTLLSDVIIYPTKNGQTIALDFGLKDAEISLPVGYVKEFNQQGTLKATVSLENNALKDISSVYLSIPEESIVVKGRVNLPKDKLFELVLDEIKAPRSDAKMTISFYQNGAFDAFVQGNSLDIQDLLYGNFFDNSANSGISDSTDFTISAQLDRLFLSQEAPFTNVNVLFKRQQGRWQDIKGSFLTTTPFTFDLDETKTKLHIQTSDVGAFLKQAGVTDRIAHGVLDSTIQQDKDGNLEGEMLITDFLLTQTSFFMKAATLLGIVDAIRGEEYISFDKAIIPFVLTAQNVIEFDDAVAYGTTMGITLRGKLTTEQVDLSGSVVPAYALNSFFGKIPVVGTLLAGEKGGGLFGVTYTITGPLKKAEFDFNPASLLAPGIFRRLF